MMITNQKRMAAQILSRKEGRQVGVHRVWIHPDYLDEVSSAVQKDDIRELIEEGLIRAKPIKGTSRVRARKAACLLYTSPSPRDKRQSRMPSSA